VEHVDVALDRLIAPNTTVEKVADGFGFTEGPVWDSSTASLLFSDVPGNVIYRYTPADRKTVVFMHRAGFQGADIWRWGGMNDNGRDDEDPSYERFPMIGPDGLCPPRIQPHAGYFRPGRRRLPFASYPGLALSWGIYGVVAQTSPINVQRIERQPWIEMRHMVLREKQDSAGVQSMLPLENIEI
jgi:hypothetical protein